MPVQDSALNTRTPLGIPQCSRERRYLFEDASHSGQPLIELVELPAAQILESGDGRSDLPGFDLPVFLHDIQRHDELPLFTPVEIGMIGYEACQLLLVHRVAELEAQRRQVGSGKSLLSSGRIGRGPP